MQVEIYRAEHFAGVKALWEEAFPDDPPRNSAEAAIPAKLAVQPGLFFVALDGGEIIGTAMAGYDGHRGWLYSVAVRHDRRRCGIGSALVTRAEQGLRQAGCGKINLQLRAANHAVVEFYRRLGYSVEERISMGKRC